MVDPLSISQLIVAIPQIIDYGVETIRAIRKYNKIDADFRFALERADDLICLLRVRLIIAQLNPLTEELEDHVSKALTRTHHYMVKLNTVLDEWRVRLQYNTDETSISDEKKPSEKSDSPSCEVACAPYSLTKIRKSCGLHLHTGLRPLRLRLDKLRYMVLGTLSIEEALHKLETSNKTLAEFFPVNPYMAQLTSYNKDATSFARTAKQRDEPCTELSISLKRAPLEETDDPIFFTVTEGEYNGCIVERRTVRSSNWNERDRALEETDLLTKRLREDKQVLNGTTTTKIGLLRCCGYTVPYDSAHDLIFRKPVGHTARTLRNLLCSPDSENHRIDARLDFAITLATAVHIFHSIGFVHKTIKPDSILVMQPIGSSNEHLYDLGTPYLANFNAARYDENESGMYNYDKTMNKKLYLHPRQLVPNRHLKYRMHDDVYSLGVCLLEIGLWRSAFRWDETRPRGKRYVVAEWARDFFVDPPRVNDRVPKTDDGEYLGDVMRKQKLIRLAETLLPTKMNDIYCQAVVTCLTFEEDKYSAMEENDACVGSGKFFSDVLCELRHAKGISSRRRSVH